MSRKLAIVVGLGEIGRPIYQMLCDAYGNDEVRGKDLFRLEPSSAITRAMDHTFNFMHICFSQNPNFVQQLRDYIGKYSPEHIIIHATLSPGMTTFLDGEFLLSKIFYSPVRGNTGDGMLWSLKKYTKYVAAFGLGELDYYPVTSHLRTAGFKVQYLGDPFALECAKIWDLAWYGLNIAFYQEMERALNEAAVELTRSFIGSTPEESDGKVPRILFYGGFIGGHCVIPAIEKILADHDIPMLRAVLDSNLKRFIELTYEKPPHHP